MRIPLIASTLSLLFALIASAESPPSPYGPSADPVLNSREYVSVLNVMEANTGGGAQNPQGTDQRTSSSTRQKATTRLSGISAGEDYVLPEGESSALNFEYNYVQTGLDNPGSGAGLSGESNIYAVGYEMVLNDSLFLDLGYEYAKDNLAGLVGAAVDIETHTVSGAISGTLVDNIYGMLIVGGSFSEGGCRVAGVPLGTANSSGDTFFISPGIGTTWVFGDLIVDASVAYLFQHADTVLRTGAVRNDVMTEVDQLVVDLGARYNLTDSLYARVGVQYNNILDENFNAALQLDKNWLQLNSELGVDLAGGVGVYVGHAYEANHFIYNQHTYRAGVSIPF